MSKEIWKPVVDFENIYEVSNIGNVKSVDRMVNHPSGSKSLRKGKVLKPYTDSDGYYRVNLVNGKIRKSVFVHRLVCEAFLPNPENKPVIDHISGIKTLNTVENLRWATCKENDNNPNTIWKKQGENHPFYGKHHSPETRKLIGEKGKGRPSPNKGKSMSEEQKRKISFTKRNKQCLNHQIEKSA